MLLPKKTKDEDDLSKEKSIAQDVYKNLSFVANCFNNEILLVNHVLKFIKFSILIHLFISVIFR